MLAQVGRVAQIFGLIFGRGQNVPARAAARRMLKAGACPAAPHGRATGGNQVVHHRTQGGIDMNKIGIAAGALALVSAAATPASAQTTTTPSSPAAPPSATTPPSTANTPPSATTTPPVTATTPESGRDVRGYMSAPVRAPNKAFELGLDAGYTQGFGNIGGGRGAPDVGGAGGTFGLSLGYRINPSWSVAATGQYQGFGTTGTAPNTTTVRGATAGVQGTYHISPYNRLNPFVTVGTGYRAIMESPAGNVPMSVTHGFELGKVEVGLELRPTESIAVAPVIGADLNYFVWRTGGGTETATLTDRGVNAFVFAGVKGRFDIGGSRESRPAEQQVGRR